MVAEWLQKLLILQDRDSRCDGIHRQLEAIPAEIAADERSIKALDQQLAAAETELKQLEVRRLDLEGEVEQTEATILRYRTQQMQVKKNEEYTALEKEIASLKEKISGLEDTELQVLEAIDLKREAVKAMRETISHERHTLEAHIAKLRQNHDSFAAELDEARQAVTDCEAGIDAGILQQYRYVKGQVKRPPIVVQLDQGRCQGCHLKVSGEIESEARRGTGLVRCDSCGRILYFDR